MRNVLFVESFLLKKVLLGIGYNVDKCSQNNMINGMEMSNMNQMDSMKQIKNMNQMGDMNQMGMKMNSGMNMNGGMDSSSYGMEK